MTTTLGAGAVDGSRGPYAYEYPLANFDVVSLARLLETNARVTVEKHDGTLIVYELVKETA